MNIFFRVIHLFSAALLAFILLTCSSSGNFQISYGDSFDGSTVFLWGDTVDFGAVNVSQSKEITFYLDNDSESYIIFECNPSIVFSGTDANQFSLSQEISICGSSFLSNYLWYATTPFSIKIAFTPLSTGQKNATATITQFRPRQEELTFNLTGTAN